ncbi:MAG: carbon-nitrogen family hydrolase [Ignavibacteriales bacterium]|nr:MAG: carbon-nitrogen family hydrolase [Ignavibacteriales bacterium]
MKIGLVQYSPVWENKSANQEKINSLIKKCNAKFDVIVLPEMTLTGFTMNSKKMAEVSEGDSFKYFSDMAVKNSCDVLAGIIEVENDKYFNTLLHITSDGMLKNHYRKIHPFSYSDENLHYEKGNTTVVTKVQEFNTGLSICYDLRFPELYRQYGKARTELIVNIANWPVTRIEHWRTLLKARAIENQCYVVGVNRVGDDPKLHYNGYSSVFDPMGNELLSVENEEGVFVAELSLEKVKEVRTKFPFLDDMRLI